MFRIEVTGLDEMMRSLDRLAENARSLSGEQTVPLRDVLRDDFMRANTEFGSFQEMLTQSGFTVETQSDFDAIPRAEWDAYVRSHTNFQNWGEMLTAGGREYFGRKLFEG